jgi:hypothetical protein
MACVIAAARCTQNGRKSRIFVVHGAREQHSWHSQSTHCLGNCQSLLAMSNTCAARLSITGMELHRKLFIFADGVVV